MMPKNDSLADCTSKTKQKEAAKSDIEQCVVFDDNVEHCKPSTARKRHSLQSLLVKEDDNDDVQLVRLSFLTHGHKENVERE